MFQMDACKYLVCALSPTPPPETLKGPEARLVPLRGESRIHGWIIDAYGGYVDHRLYNVDLRFSQRYAMDHGLFPMGLVRYGNGIWTPEEEHFALEYPLPPLKRALLDLHVDHPAGNRRRQDKLLGARLEGIELDGSEETILRGIDEAVRSADPDILMTDGGDAFVMPYLARKAAELGVTMQLGRDPDKFAERKGKSHFTYGKIVFKPGQYILRGRLHLDRGHFAMRESDFAGLAELSRLSTLTPQEQARLTPGTAFTAMQTNLAYQDGCLVVWKKNRPEDFKDAENLLRGDRGGFTFEPEVGVHEGLYELDFSSLYPSIMVKYNISAETLDCVCCLTDGLPVPELRYHLCTRRVGIVGRVLKPLIERRRYYKKMKKEPGPLQDVYTGRDTILKWTLVTSFGYQGYKNARFGRIECHEAINAYARDILVRTMEIAESHGYEVVHGIVDSVWLRPKPNADAIEKVREHIAGSIGLPIELEGRYKWIVFLPCKTTGVGALNRYYGLFQDDEFKLRGIELRKHDTPEFINICQEAMLGELSLASTAAEFLERIPKAVDILRWTAKCVLDRAIPVHQFILTKSVSRTLTEYVVLTATAAALKQLEKRGFPVEPGESVRYVLMDARARDSERKVRVAEFLQGDEAPDAWEYIKLLARSGQTLLAPFGYTEDKLFAMCKDLSDLSRTDLPDRAIAIQEDYKSAGESRSSARGGVGYKKPWRILADPEGGPEE